jgi:putative heme transporter
VEADESRPRTSKRHTFWRVAWYAIALGIVAYAVYSQHSQLVSAFHELAHIRWKWLALAGLAELASLAYLSRMQRRLLRAGGTRISRGTSLALVFAQSAMSMSFPQYRARGADQALSAWVLVVSGIASNAALAALAFAGAEAADLGGVVLTVVVSILLLALLVGLTILGRQRSAIEALAGRMLRWLKRRVGRPKGDPDALVGDAMRQIGTIHASRTDLVLVAVAALMNWGTDLLCLVCSFRALHAHPPWPGIIVAFTFGQLASSIPFLPGGLGLVEGSVAASLVAYGTPRSIALAVVLIYRLISFWAVIAVGWILWLVLRARSHPALEAKPAPVATQSSSRRA